jgi:imidazole glycerol-phosphate synthase subunit HisH
MVFKKIMTIGIIDIGVGNIGSVVNAVYSQGWDSISITRPEDLSSVSHLIIPGVGSFSYIMNRLRELSLDTSICDFASQGSPVLGICLGMQILGDAGSEGVYSLGLGLISGEVNPINRTVGLPLPHVGWNDAVEVNKHPLLDGVKSGVDFYFVNSYCFSATNRKNVILETEYGECFPAMIANKNVVGMQFHPEKSQRNGLRLLDNFCLWDGTC